MKVLKQLHTVLLTLIIASLTFSPIHAEVPNIVNFSGTMSNNFGAIEGQKTVTTTLVAEDEETSIWTQVHTGVSFEDGKFTLQIGQDSEDELSYQDANSATFLKIEIEGEEGFLLFDLTSSFFALSAEHATTADSAHSIEWSNITNKPTNLGSIEDTVTTNATKLQHLDISTSMPTTGQVLKWNGTSWAPASDHYEPDTDTDTITTNATAIHNRSISTETPEIGHVLKWDGSEWSPQGDDGGSYTLTKATDTTLGGVKIDDSSRIDIDENGFITIDISGIDTDTDTDTITTNATKLQHYPISDTAPSSGQALIWNGDSWEPNTIESGTSYDAGDGIKILDNTISILGDVVTNNYNGTITANAFVGNGSGLTGIVASISDGSITTAKISDDAITTAKISDNAITSAKISSDGIDFSKLNIEKEDIVSLGIPEDDTTYTAGYGLLQSGYNFTIDTSIVVTRNYHGTITANSFIGNFIGDGSGLVGISDSLSNGSITTAKISDAAITTAKISDDAITSAKISSDGIDFSKLNIEKEDIVSLGIPEDDTTYTAGYGLLQSGHNFTIDTSIVVTRNYHGTITANSFIGNFIGDGSGLVGISDSLSNGSITTAKISDAAITSAKINSGSITNSHISAIAGIEFTKLNMSLEDLETLGLPTSPGYGLEVEDNQYKISTNVVTSNYRYAFTADSISSQGNIIGTTGIFSTVQASLAKINNADYIVEISNSATNSNADVLSLSLGASTPGAGNSYIDFYSDSTGSPTLEGSISGSGGGSVNYALLENSSEDAIAFMDKQGIILESSGADYAEYIKKENTRTDFEPGELVGIKNGYIVASTEDADRIMSISAKPIVIGNAPKDKKDDYELVAFVGQVFIKVKGSVTSGQYIIASDEAGIGIAKHKHELTSTDLTKVVGQAWETSTKTQTRLVKAGITPMDMSLIQADRLTQLETTIYYLLKRLEALENN